MDQKTLSALEKIVRNALKEILKTDAPVKIEDIFIGVGNRRKTASKEWQKGCMYHLAGQRLVERNADTYLVKEKSAIRQIISHYPLTQEVAICGTAIAASNFENIYALSIFQRLTDEQYAQLEEAARVVRELSKGKPIRRDELFSETESWQSAFMKRLVATGFCSVKGWTRWVEYKIKANKTQPDNEEILELLFPKWFRYVQRVTTPGFLKIEKRPISEYPHPEEVKLEHVVSNHPEPKSESEPDQANVGLIILEKLVQYLQVLEYQSTRLDKIEAKLDKISILKDEDFSASHVPQEHLNVYGKKPEKLHLEIEFYVADKTEVTTKEICKYLKLNTNPRGRKTKEIADILRKLGFTRTKKAIYDSKLKRKVQTRIFKR